MVSSPDGLVLISSGVTKLIEAALVIVYKSLARMQSTVVYGGLKGLGRSSPCSEACLTWAGILLDDISIGIYAFDKANAYVP